MAPAAIQVLISRLSRLASLTHSAPLVLACRVSTLHGEAHFFLKVSTQDSSTCMSTYEETAKLPAPCRQSSTLARMVKTTNRNDATVTKPFFIAASWNTRTQPFTSQMETGSDFALAADRPTPVAHRRRQV